ncbi:PREDICTED: protein TPX2 [Nelumbo nucifera]|uniref:Protein TPX2 n=2 Tax=Nelumbo nucifera TaxID=4432 RepID=A0A1U7ZZN1_NELNU|nr:PREDICTED: protein TPX2 [Nelumbo nucifera]DAD35008.1 TPA_asm: hypothetical protein HUJ06_005648 [Nelumbo nucifera]
MDLGGKNCGTMTPTKDPKASRSKVAEVSKFSENFDPNRSTVSPLKPGNTPLTKSAKSKKSAPKTPNQIISPRAKIRERKFVVAKKKSKTALSTATCKCKEKMGGNLKKCPCIAYESLRASQEEFFRNRSSIEHEFDFDESTMNFERPEGEEDQRIPIMENLETAVASEDKAVEGSGHSMNDSGNQVMEEHELSSEMGSSKIKRRRDKLMEEARNSIPEPGSGRVMHLVKAFERLLSIPSSKESKRSEEGDDNSKKGMKWALPGLQPKAQETEVSSSSFCPSELFFTSENFGTDSRISSSVDSSQGSFTFTSSRGSGGTRRTRRKSAESIGSFGGSKWKKKQQLRVTRQQPFKLRTEQRGRSKEEEFLKKVQEMMMEEERLRIPVAQGLPWTTDEPECLVKPPVKENTKPIDLKLHSDVRAIERAEFDHHVAEKLNLIEQYRMERERQQKLAEEEEIKQMRRELVPKAQPMPYFDRPFIPKRSTKHPTIPREPKFHIPQHKKIKCMSWTDMSIYTHQH